MSDDAGDAPESMTAADVSLIEALDRFGQAGWTANHLAAPDGHVRCGDCNVESAAASITIDARHRLEGASDPQDMIYVFGFSCPACGTPGVIAAGYGPAASEQDQRLIAALGDDHDAVDPLAADPT